MDDTSKPRGFGPSLVARLLLEASADPQLRLLFGFPPKDLAPHGMRHPPLLQLPWNGAAADAKDSKSNVVPFPVVARPHLYRDGVAPPVRRRRRRAAPKPPPKTP